MFTVDVNFVRLDVSSTWHRESLNCGSRCNSTLAPPATCACVLWENSDFCVGVRGPHSRELRYIRGIWQVACASWAFSAVKNMIMVGLLVEQLHHTAMEVGVNLVSTTKTSNRDNSYADHWISFIHFLWMHRFGSRLKCILAVGAWEWAAVLRVFV